jgi:hypothetical protein
MKVLHGEHVIELTERNLRALLAKLAGHPPNSACTIYKDGWCVRAVSDAAHYVDRRPGEVDADTENHLGDA